MATIRDERVLYGFTGKTSPKIFTKENELGVEEVADINKSELEGKKIIGIARIKKQNTNKIILDIYKTKSPYDTAIIEKINQSNDSIENKIKDAINYVKELGGEDPITSFETSLFQTSSSMVASAPRLKIESELKKYLEGKTDRQGKNKKLNIIVVSSINPENKIIIEDVIGIKQVAGMKGVDFYFYSNLRDKNNNIIGKTVKPNSMFSHKALDAETYKGFITWANKNSKTSLAKEFEEFKNCIKTYVKNLPLKNNEKEPTKLPIIKQMVFNDKTKKEFIKFLYGGSPITSRGEISGAYKFILFSNSEPIIELVSSNEEEELWILKPSDGGAIYINPDIPQNNHAPYMYARIGQHGTKIENFDFRLYVSPAYRAENGMPVSIACPKSINISESFLSEMNELYEIYRSLLEE